MIETRLREVMEAALRLPLLIKLVVANTAVLVLGVGFTAWVLSTTGSHFGSAPALLAGAVLASIVLGVIANAVVVHFALSPLRRMEETATRIDRGREDARVGTSSIADPELGRLMRRFDQILDTLTEARERQQVAASLLVDSEERVRMRIADDLYGDVGQRLAAILLLVGRVARSTSADRDSEAATSVLARIQEELAEVLEGVRRTARNLRPPELDDLGIMAAVQAEVRTVDARSGIPVVLESGPSDLPLGKAEGLVLFRLIQEGLSLILEGRSVDASSRGASETDDPVEGTTRNGVSLSVQVSEDSVRCDIESDRPIHAGSTRADPAIPDVRRPGPMEDPNPRVRPTGRLEPMRERAAWIGGTVTILDRRPTGSILRIVIPVGRRHSDPRDGNASRARLSA